MDLPRALNLENHGAPREIFGFEINDFKFWSENGTKNLPHFRFKERDFSHCRKEMEIIFTLICTQYKTQFL